MNELRLLQEEVVREALRGSDTEVELGLKIRLTLMCCTITDNGATAACAGPSDRHPRSGRPWRGCHRTETHVPNDCD